MSKTSCLRSRSVAGACSVCGRDMGLVAHLSLIANTAPTCPACCPACNAPDAPQRSAGPSVIVGVHLGAGQHRGPYQRRRPQIETCSSLLGRV